MPGANAPAVQVPSTQAPSPKTPSQLHTGSLTARLLPPRTPPVIEPVRGIVRAPNEAQLTSELTAKVVSIPFREGEAFNKGDVLIAFDCGKFNADHKAAKAEEDFNDIVLKNSVELDKLKAIGKFEVAQNEAKLNKARAQTETTALRVQECQVFAPFSGKIAELRAKAHEISQPSQPLMRIVDSSALEVEIIVPSLWLRWIKPGLTFNIKVDETETVHVARVQRIAATVDPASQTVKLMGVFTETAANVLPGMSLTAEIEPLR